MHDDLQKINESAKQAREELALAIGKFSIHFAEMEDRLNCAIHELLGLEPDTGHALTSAVINISTRLDILGTLLRDLPSAEPYRDVLSDIVARAIDLNSYRNWLLHDAWAGSVNFSYNPGWRHQKRRMRPKGGGRAWQHSDFTNTDIEAYATKCNDVSNDLAPVLNQLSRVRVERKKKVDQSE